jgi:outer membrane lipopolysaccharide assembly protein LptE/RlpB
MFGQRIKLALILSAIPLFLASCGYHFSGEGQGPKPGLVCIAIPVFENKTSEPNAGAIFAGALRETFMTKGTMKVVSVEDAQAVFKGTVKSIEISPIAHHAVSAVSKQVTVENRLFITLDVSCVEKGTHKILWHDPAFRYYKVYQINDNPLEPQPIIGFENREDALRFLAREMSIRIHDRFLSNF